LNLVILANQGK